MVAGRGVLVEAGTITAVVTGADRSPTMGNAVQVVVRATATLLERTSL